MTLGRPPLMSRHDAAQLSHFDSNGRCAGERGRQTRHRADRGRARPGLHASRHAELLREGRPPRGLLNHRAPRRSDGAKRAGDLIPLAHTLILDRSTSRSRWTRMAPPSVSRRGQARARTGSEMRPLTP